MCNLGSGSGGNCTVLRLERRAILLDAGFGPRTTQRRLAQAGVDLADVHAICLTHLDRDHFRPTWVTAIQKHRIRLLLHRWHLPDLHRVPGGRALRKLGLVQTFDGDAFEPMPGLTATAFRCQHDLQGTISYRLRSRAGEVGHATDLGHVSPGLIEHLAGVDLLALECNYDEHMTIHSSRPAFVNRRNMSDSGHLSNEQAFDAIQRIDAVSPGGNPQRIVLLHRSSQCNHPTKVRRIFERDPRLAGRITLTEQRRRTRWLTVKPQRAVHRHQLFIPY
ncbi:MAG: MBL fold metallo-hydrolase [Phycisphaeraceae bacterium]